MPLRARLGAISTRRRLMLTNSSDSSPSAVYTWRGVGFPITRSKIAARTFSQALICLMFLVDLAAARYLQLGRAGNMVQEQEQ